MAELADQYDVLIFEDDPYRDIRFTGHDLAPIKSFDKSGKVIMVGKYGGKTATIPAVYDEESGLWIAEGNYSTWIADELHDFNVLIVPKEDIENGVRDYLNRARGELAKAMAFTGSASLDKIDPAVLRRV